MRVGSSRTAALAGLVMLVAAAQSRDAPFAPSIAALERVATDLAKAGNSAEVDETLQLLTELGMDAKAHDKFASACRQESAKTKKSAAVSSTVVPALEKVGKELASRLDGLSDPERANLARVILRLDDRIAEAHGVLGQELVDGKWLDAAGKARHARENVIAIAVAKARLLDVKVDVGPSHHPEFAGIRCSEPLVAKFDRVEIHSVWSEAKLRRAVLAIVRCSALINLLMSDRLEVPTFPARTYVLFGDVLEFRAAVQRGAKDGRVDPLVAQTIEKLSGAYFGSDELVVNEPFEGRCESVLAGDLVAHVEWRAKNATVSLRDRESWLSAGLINWSTLTLLGERLPVYTFSETKEGSSGSGRTSALSNEQRIERERLLRLSDAGISGGRAWLEYLARRGEDPPISASFRDQMGRIQGDDLLKSTFVVEMLAQEGPLIPLLLRLPLTLSVEAATHSLELARKQSLADFESNWRASFLPPIPGLVQRLSSGGLDAHVPEGERQALELLNSMRAQAGADDGPIDFDAAAAAACTKHARYLARHPGQRDKWPDAHEEYPDRADFDPSGAWAGSHSVVAPGVKSSRDALSRWMGSFYHRLPLLDPKLVRIGSACTEGCAVLDCGSFVKPAEELTREPDMLVKSKDPRQWAVVWPAPKATDVPTRFAPELPEPVPGVSSATLGYPITFQRRHVNALKRYEIDFVVHLGAANGPAVDCYVSTPSAPTNPIMSTQFAWCLMPKAPLQSGATYTVTGRLQTLFDYDPSLNATFDVEWSFRCGK